MPNRARNCQDGLDMRCRDENGEIRRKWSDPAVSRQVGRLFGPALWHARQPA